MLELSDVSLAYAQPVLNAVSFRVNAGEVLGIAGCSGAGKTSLLKIIAGLKDADAGTVTFLGKKIVGPKAKLVPGYEDIQLVNQDFGLDLYHTVEENIREKMLHLPKTAQVSFVEELLNLVELEAVRNQQAIVLSGGEQQRLSIARALACEPKLLLLDEPFVHLDARLRLKITQYLFRLKEVRQMALILVSHNGEEMLSLADTVIYLKKGTIRRKAAPKEMYYAYKSKEEGELFGWVNACRINGKMIYFRPDEFVADAAESAEVRLKFENALFCGGFYLNNFRSEDGKIVVLLDQETLKKGEGINVRKKNKKAKLE